MTPGSLPLRGNYDPDNIFAKILRGDLPCHRVYEDGNTLVFMDLMPQAPGHALVLSKAPARNLMDVAEADLLAAVAVARKVGRAAARAFGADGVLLSQFSGGPVGQTVPHIHIHVVPHAPGTPFELHPRRGQAPAEELAANCEKLKAALALEQDA